MSQCKSVLILVPVNVSSTSIMGMISSFVTRIRSSLQIKEAKYMPLFKVFWNFGADEKRFFKLFRILDLRGCRGELPGVWPSEERNIYYNMYQRTSCTSWEKYNSCNCNYENNNTFELGSICGSCIFQTNKEIIKLAQFTLGATFCIGDFPPTCQINN